jgi:hypothetical protein
MLRKNTNSNLSEALKALEGRVLSPSERQRQKISWVMGTIDENNTMTQRQVESLLEREAG